MNRHRLIAVAFLGLAPLALASACSSESHGSGAVTSGNAPEPTPHCLEATEGSAYGCARVSDQDQSCAYWSMQEGWGEAYECPCLGDDCKTNGAPCDGANSTCPECIGFSPTELGLGCVEQLNGANERSTIFCCGPDHDTPAYGTRAETSVAMGAASAIHPMATR